MSNAHKHGLLPQGGGRLSVDVRVEDGRLVLEVIDDGPGFPPGFQPEASQGLGFRLVLALLQRHEGVLTVLPGPGGRTRVELKILSLPG
jgi:two-component sensor histidine kinase